MLLWAWCGLETSGPLWPHPELLTVPNVLQRGRFSLPQDPQCLSEDPSTPTEWLVTPVTDPWLCQRTTHGDKGLYLQAPGPSSQER